MFSHKLHVNTSKGSCSSDWRTRTRWRSRIVVWQIMPKCVITAWYCWVSGWMILTQAMMCLSLIFLAGTLAFYIAMLAKSCCKEDKGLRFQIGAQCFAMAAGMLIIGTMNLAIDLICRDALWDAFAQNIFLARAPKIVVVCVASILWSHLFFFYFTVGSRSENRIKNTKINNKRMENQPTAAYVTKTMGAGSEMDRANLALFRLKFYMSQSNKCKGFSQVTVPTKTPSRAFLKMPMHSKSLRFTETFHIFYMWQFAHKW